MEVMSTPAGTSWLSATFAGHATVLLDAARVLPPAGATTFAGDGLPEAAP